MQAHEDRPDAVFALPVLPRRVRVFGDWVWREGLAKRGFDVTDADGEVVVVADEDPALALASHPDVVLVDGDPRAAAIFRRAGYATARLLSLPVSGAPVVYADLAGRRGARYAATHGIVHAQRWRTARNAVVGAALGARVPLPFARLVTVAAASPRPPALIAAGSDLGVDRNADWMMQVSPGSVARRNAFLLFERGSSTPTLALKFGRVRGMTEPFDREDAGYAVLARIGPAVAARMPSSLGRFDVEGFHAALETAAVGERLSAYLRRPIRRAAKLEVVERIMAWLVHAATATSLAPGSLADERAWLLAEVFPRWGERLPDDLAADLEHLPGTFQHNDVQEENVVINRSEFTILDLEWAQRSGLPFGDLVYFAAHALRIVDGVPDERQPDHFADLFSGRAASSANLFGRVRELAAALAVPEASVGRLVTMTWVRRAELSRRERHRSERLGGRTLEPAVEELFAERWMSTPGLGPGWADWRQ